MKRTLVEKILVAAAWLCLVCCGLGGCALGVITLVKNAEMCVPQAFVYFGVACASVLVWALLIEIVRISDKIK